VLKTSAQAPRANVIAERSFGITRRELLDRILIINQRHAATALAQYQDHFNHHPHRALRQAASLRALPDQHTTKIAHVRRHDRLGGLVHEHH
jgi:putative transposase